MSTAAITKPPAGYDPGVYNSSDQSSGSASGSPPPLIPPPTNPLTQEKPPQAPSVLPNKGGKAAGIAYMFDSVLRGAMKGREQAQQQQSYKANKLMQGFQYAYQNASQQYIGMIQNDPELAKKLGELNTITSAKSPTPEQQARAKELSSDPTVVKAQQVSTAADSAWQAMQRMYNNYLNPDAQKKSKSSSSGSGSGSSKSKGGDQSGKNDGENPVQLIQSQNKQDQLRGYLAISQAVGPGYKREAAYFMSPQYQQQVSTAQNKQTLESGNAQDEVDLRNLRSQPASPERDQKIAAIENRMPNKDADKIRGERIALVESYKASGMSDDDANKQAAKDLTSKYGGKPRVTTKREPDPDSTTGWSWVNKDAITGEEYSRELNAEPQRSMITSESETTGTDPFGNVSHSQTVRKPVLPGANPTTPATPAASGTPAATSAPHGAATNAPNAAPNAAASGVLAPVNPKRQRTIPPLDNDGHISSSAGNAQVVEAANQLLDGSDKDKLPTKAREPAAALARKYGWQQGKFTPKEQVMLRESSTFLNDALKNPALAALDGSYTDRMQLAQVLKSPDKEGAIGTAVSVAASQNLDAKQAEFVRVYNQLVGTISGLAQLVRSGRATEATIDRLKAELPNPTTTKDSADGKQRIQRLIKEINVAMEKGTFEGAGKNESGAGSGAGGNVIKWKRDAQGNPVPDTSK